MPSVTPGVPRLRARARRGEHFRIEAVLAQCAASLRSMTVAQFGRCSKSDIFYAGYASSAVVQALGRTRGESV